MTTRRNPSKLAVIIAGDRSFAFHLPAFSITERQRLWAELAVTLLLIITGLLTLKTARNVVATLGLLWVYNTTDFSKPNQKRLGMIWKKSRDTLWIAGLAALTSGAIWSLAYLVEMFLYGKSDAFDPFRLIDTKLGYFIGAALQQFVIQSYCFVRLEKLLGCQAKACKWTAVLFSLCHLPNPLLMVITWYGGRLSCTLFKEHRNLFTLALAHGLIGASLAAYWPSWVMRAGIGFVKLLGQ